MGAREFWQGHSREQARAHIEQQGKQRAYSRWMTKQPMVLPTAENAQERHDDDEQAKARYPGLFTPNAVPGMARDATSVLPSEGPSVGAELPLRGKRV